MALKEHWSQLLIYISALLFELPIFLFVENNRLQEMYIFDFLKLIQQLDEICELCRMCYGWLFPPCPQRAPSAFQF